MGSTRARLRLAAGYMAGQTTGLPAPSALLVESTANCNLKCPMCWRTGSYYGTDLMPDEIIWPLLDDFARLGGDHVQLYGLNEPLLDPRIFDLLQRSHELGLGTVISSNATLLNEKKRTRLLDIGCDHFIIGLDATSDETYNFYRAGGNYQKAVANVRALCAEKVARKVKMPIVLQFIRMEKNKHEEHDFIRMWSDVEGVDEVRIKDEDLGLADHAIYDFAAEKRLNPCFWLWRGPLVAHYTGEVFACHFMGYNDRYMLGRLQEQSLEEIWNSPALAELRRQHVEHDIPEDSPCVRCPTPRPRMPFVVGSMVVPGKYGRLAIPIAEKIEHRVPGFFKEPRKRRDRNDPKPRAP